MNNKVFLTIIGSLLLVGGVLGILTFNSDSASAYLTKDEAMQKVQTQFPGEIVELELDKERNKEIYEVEIKGTDRFYELEIDAETGEVLKIEEKLFNKQNKQETAVKDDIPEVNVSQDDDNNEKATKNSSAKQNVAKKSEDDDKDDKKAQKQVTNKAKTNSDNTKSEKKKATTNNSSIISKDKAKSIALGLFNGKIEEIELDDDDGLRYYEIELESSTEEAEIKINAYTGELISISKEKHDDDDDDDDD